ncbi:acylneuraminate cytidylyltransferase [Bacteroidota bacterium]|nr:acylneuraminate cytidylyltransferase [Bacteroidota bacterium]
METIAFVPARANSKSIKNKNIKLFCGKPLIYWVLKELHLSNVDKVVLATDSNLIKEIATSFEFSKLEVFDRSRENAEDSSSTESVMLEYILNSKINKKFTFLLAQATSPFTKSFHFNQAIDLHKKYDSVLSCTIEKKFIWNKEGTSLNYDYMNRPRRQDFEGNLIENGAMYISSIEKILESKNRISGNIGVYVMPQYTALELDEPSDWIIGEQIMTENYDKDVSKIEKIKVIFSDVDGVLTDGGMYYSEKGDEIKKFSAYDGMAFQILKEKGFKVGIITSEKMKLNKRRASKLKLDYDFHGAKDKLKIIKKFCQENSYNYSEIAYIGDDVNCLDLLSVVGVAACPSNAVNQIKSVPGIIQVDKKGGEGAFREFSKLFL